MVFYELLCSLLWLCSERTASTTGSRSSGGDNKLATSHGQTLVKALHECIMEFLVLVTLTFQASKSFCTALHRLKPCNFRFGDCELVGEDFISSA